MHHAQRDKTHPPTTPPPPPRATHEFGVEVAGGAILLGAAVVATAAGARATLRAVGALGAVATRAEARARLRLVLLLERVGEHVVGQVEVLTEVLNALRVARVHGAGQHDKCKHTRTTGSPKRDAPNAAHHTQSRGCTRTRSTASTACAVMHDHACMPASGTSLVRVK